MQHISEKGLEILKEHEGLRLTAYKDGGGVWTIGWGHTGPDVVYRLKITQAQAEALLKKDVAWAEAEVARLGRFPQNQFDAMVSLAYNIGATAFRNSTLARLVRSGASPEVVSKQFPRFKYDNGKVVQGLVNRREKERALFLQPSPTPEPETPPQVVETPPQGTPKLAVVHLPVLRPPYPPSRTLEILGTILGDKTVVGFQYANGLKPDGIVGPATWGALLGITPKG